MSKRIFTLLALFTLLASPVTFAPPGVNAQAGRGAPTRQAEARVGRVVEEATRSAVYDKAGRVTSLSLLVAGGEKVSVGFEYEADGRIQHVNFDDAVQVRLDYDAAGRWTGLTFPDGGRVLLVRDKAGNVIEFTPLPKAGVRRARGLDAAPLHNAAYVKAALFFDCKSATERATDAVIAAGLVCGTTGPGIACTAAMAYAAYLTYVAAKECGFLMEESAS